MGKFLAAGRASSSTSAIDPSETGGFTESDFRGALDDISSEKRAAWWPTTPRSRLRLKIEKYLDENLKMPDPKSAAEDRSATGFSHIKHADPGDAFIPSGYVRVDLAEAKRIIANQSIALSHGSSKESTLVAFSLADMFATATTGAKPGGPPLPMHGTDTHENPVLFVTDMWREGRISTETDPHPHNPGRTKIAQNDWSWASAAWLSAMSQHSPESLKQILEKKNVDPTSCKRVALLAETLQDQKNEKHFSLDGIVRMSADGKKPERFKFSKSDQRMLKELTEDLLEDAKHTMPKPVEGKPFDHTPYIITLLRSLDSHAAITSDEPSTYSQKDQPIAISIVGVDDFEGVEPDNVEEQRKMATAAYSRQPILIRRGNFYDIQLLNLETMKQIKSQDAGAAAQKTIANEVAEKVRDTLTSLKKERTNTEPPSVDVEDEDKFSDASDGFQPKIGDDHVS